MILSLTLAAAALNMAIPESDMAIGAGYYSRGAHVSGADSEYEWRHKGSNQPSLFFTLDVPGPMAIRMGEVDHGLFRKRGFDSMRVETRSVYLMGLGTKQIESVELSAGAGVYHWTHFAGLWSSRDPDTDRQHSGSSVAAMASAGWSFDRVTASAEAIHFHNLMDGNSGVRDDSGDNFESGDIDMLFLGVSMTYRF